jgi:hypothetical protein
MMNDLPVNSIALPSGDDPTRHPLQSETGDEPGALSPMLVSAATTPHVVDSREQVVC